MTSIAFRFFNTVGARLGGAIIVRQADFMDIFVEWAKAAPLLIAVGSLVTATMSYFSFRHIRRTSVRDTTVGLIMKMSSDAYVCAMMDRFRCLRLEFSKTGNTNPDFDDVIKTVFVWSGKQYDPTRVIRDMFNFYESISLGIQEGWIDEKIFKSYWRSSYIFDFKDFENYVSSFRVNHDGAENAFRDFEALVRKWDA